jgi:hypothetical protein
MIDERHRVARLKALAAEIEELPRSETRDALLWDVRSRAVAIDTGVEHARPSFGQRSRDSDAGTNSAVPVP